MIDGKMILCTKGQGKGIIVGALVLHAFGFGLNITKVSN
jgi:hypothetical protein